VTRPLERTAQVIKMVGRREFIAILATAAASRAMAQTTVPRPLVAVLEGTSAEVAPYYLRPFEQTLREHGHVNGQTIDFVHKFADGDASRYPALAEELIRLTPAVLVTGSTTGALACKRLTATIPIVSANLTDPIGLGLISTLARPGGNVTGVVISLEGLPGKLLQILREVVPEARRIGLLANPSERANARQRQAAERVAAGLGMTFITVPVRTRDDIASAFEEFLRARVEAIYAPSSLMLRAERQYFAERALAARLPTMCNAREIVEAGALMSYGTDLRENYRRAAHFVDRILKGRRPADLPTENPTRFVLSINLKTAKSLGLAIPPTLLASADEVIE